MRHKRFLVVSLPQPGRGGRRATRCLAGRSAHQNVHRPRILLPRQDAGPAAEWLLGRITDQSCALGATLPPSIAG